MKHIDQKIIEKILQVKELAEKGHKGEADAARIMLHKLMLKHNLTLEDLNSITGRKLWIHREGKLYTALVIKTIAAYLGYERMKEICAWKTRSGGCQFEIELHDYEIIELEIMIKRYKRLYKKEMASFKKMFGEAFYAKHQLGCSVPDREPRDVQDEFTPEEAKKLRSIYEGLSDTSYRKALTP